MDPPIFTPPCGNKERRGHACAAEESGVRLHAKELLKELAVAPVLTVWPQVSTGMSRNLTIDCRFPALRFPPGME
jgi:hypothetical protein